MLGWPERAKSGGLGESEGQVVGSMLGGTLGRGLGESEGQVVGSKLGG